MRRILRILLAAGLITVVPWLLASSEAHAQSTSMVRSLGGYGAIAAAPMASMGSNSPMIPYAGSFGGFMPYRMAGGSSSPVSVSARGSAVPESARTSFRLTPMSSEMGVGLGASSRSLAPLGSKGATRLGGGFMNQPMGGSTNTGVMPPNFGYPFYRPPDLFSPVSPSAGMSM